MLCFPCKNVGLPRHSPPPVESTTWFSPSGVTEPRGSRFPRDSSLAFLGSTLLGLMCCLFVIVGLGLLTLVSRVEVCGPVLTWPQQASTSWLSSSQRHHHSHPCLCSAPLLVWRAGPALPQIPRLWTHTRAPLSCSSPSVMTLTSQAAGLWVGCEVTHCALGSQARRICSKAHPGPRTPGCIALEVAGVQL